MVIGGIGGIVILICGHSDLLMHSPKIMGGKLKSQRGATQPSGGTYDGKGGISGIVNDICVNG
jgi:hypothetical protein